MLVPNKFEKIKKQEESENFIKSESYVKIDFSQIDGIKNEQYSLMTGLYSKLRPGIAYINPKVNEPHELLEGRPPRKVMIDRMKKVYSTINIGTLLKKVGIDYSIRNDLDEWLPLEFFDDKELDIYTPEEWMIKTLIIEGDNLFIPGVGLKIDEDGTGTWKRVLINNYNYENERFNGYWDTNQEQITMKTTLDLNSMENCSLPKIHILFDAENPYLFCKKVSLAHQERKKAESIIRYNYYIDKMLNDNLNDITDDQKTRLKKKISDKGSFFKGMDSKVEELIKDLNWNFLRTTNKIIFDKYYHSKFSESLIINNLSLPENIVTTIEAFESKSVRYLGLEVIPKYNYISSYKNFTFGTLLCRKEIIRCLHKIKEECYKIRDNSEIFNLNITSPLRLQKFKQIQKAALGKIEKLICKEWTKTLKETLEKSLKNVGKGSFNLKVSSKEIYEYLKLKKYMTVVKLIMQDTLHTLTTKSITKYVEFFEKFVPEEVVINEVNKVDNHFKETIIQEELNTTYELVNKGEAANQKKVENVEIQQEEDEYLINPGDHWPLFKVNLIKREDKSVDITTKPEELLKDLKALFDEGLKLTQKVPQVEPELLSNLIKKADNHVIPLKSIIKSGKSKPEATSSEKIRQGYELNDDSIWIWEMYNRLDNNIQKAVAPIKPYIKMFDMFKEDIHLDTAQIIKQMKDEKEKWPTLKIKEDIVKNKARGAEIQSLIPETINVSFFQINCKEFREDLSKKYEKFSDLQIELLKERALESNKEVLNKYATMRKEITKEIENIDDLVAVKNFIEEVDSMQEQLKDKIDEVNLIYDILDEFKVNIEYAQFTFRSQMAGGPADIKTAINSIFYSLEKKNDQLYEEQVENQKKLDDEIDTLKKNLKVFDTFLVEDKYKDAYEFADQVYKNLEEIMKFAQLYNDREVLFQKNVTDYSGLYDLKSTLEPYYWLWMSIYTWKEKTQAWYKNDFSKLSGKEVQSVHDDCHQNLKAASNRFADMDGVLPEIVELCNTYKQITIDYKNTVELAIALTQQGYTEMHWNDILQKTGFDCCPREGFTFKHIIDGGMLKHLDFCVEVGERAYRQFLIGQSLDAIEKKWREIVFQTVSHKTTGVQNIANWNDIYKDLDNDIGEIQQLEISQFKGPYTERISTWSKDLLNISNVLEEWNKLQRFWIYLQPVFDSHDIAHEIPNENKKFTMTDRMWRDLMSGLEKLAVVKTNCNKEGLLDKLKEANMNLNNVEKGLNDYMEKKRGIFPRFYFISNSQFLEILSQTKDIKKVKDNLGKIFESIEDIFLNSEGSIEKFYSRLKEEHVIVSPVVIYKKNLEVWMLSLETQIFATVRWYIENSLIDYNENPRVDWVGRHPGQSIMCVNQIGWTNEMEKNIINKSLKHYLEVYNTKILDIVDIVRTNSSRLKAITFANLITIDVHNKQIVEMLLKNNVEEIHSFEWLMQLRYYWEIYEKNKHDVIVKSVQTDFPYGYEYIGNAEILVITPLTDKCYLTLMGALRLNLGGAPAGPAGTGKTESTKDLARSLAKLCIVYNCSDDTDYKMLGKFFKGLACCGAWICFDEFNRINLEVLSVIAQQLLKLFGSKEKKEYEIIFEESNIKILPTFCVFITMNPGYAGRSELPDNLKALFRPIAMMVPNYALIAEISLYSSGYVSANDLATKVVYTMKLSSEQLSSNTHYDFGMRAVKAVLNAARRLKRTEEDTPEDQLLLRALEDVNVPKFLEEDILLFKNIISDLFPTTERPKIDYELLLSNCESVCKKVNLLPTKYFKQKIIQLFDTLQVRHGLMIVGPAGGGKTSNYSVLREAIGLMSKDDPKFYETESKVINPKAVRNSEIYSELDVNTGEWEFGILPTWINLFKADVSGKKKYWIVFDGPVDAMWIEDMNSVLDDSKKLCLASSDIIVLNEYITIMFEVEDLIVASPATVSRCGMVFMEPTSLGIEPVYMSWLKKLPKCFTTSKIDKTIKAFFEKYIAKSLEYLRKKLVEPCPTVNNGLLNSLLKIIDAYFEKFRVNESRKTIEEEAKAFETNIEALFIYALIWSVGVTTNSEGRIRFDKYFRELIKENLVDQSISLPTEGLVYDFHFDIETRKWKHWLETVNQFEIPNNMSYTDIIIPTSDSIRNKYLIKHLAKTNKHVITTGPTGTGKTIGINELMTREMGDKYSSFNINFSAQTTARQTQDTLDSKLKKKSRDLYAPDNNKIGLVFVDDLNMPVRQSSGAQPPIEFIRQWLDHKQWYDLTTKTPKRVNDLVFLGAMGPPIGGRSLITQRFQRHFNIIGFTELEDSSIKRIFNMKLAYFFTKFNDEIKSTIENLVSGALDVYKEIKKELLAIPGKMHYIFNLRDMSKVIQGISSASKHISTKVEVVRLWSHELVRVFGDRLINDKDRDWLNNEIHQKYKKLFELEYDEVHNTGPKILFCDFNKGDKQRTYSQTQKFEELISEINKKLGEYNDGLGKKKPLNLVMFLDACDHVCRISRILRQPGGNALLFGVGGSGRQSLSKLATFINAYDCNTIEVVKGYSLTEFSKSVKDCLMKCGNPKDNAQTFLLVDTQLIFNNMLEMVNNILNTGEVAGIFKQEEMDSITNLCKDECKRLYGAPNATNIMKVFTSRVVKRIHIVLAMSPIGDIFSQRLRNFPSLVACSTIDWFAEWPEDALQSVAKEKIKDFTNSKIEKYENQIVNAFKFIHKSVEIDSKDFSEKLRKHFYLTPTSYLELINMYKKVLEIKTKEIVKSIERLETGLKVLKTAEEQVIIMKKEINERQPILEEKVIKTDKLVEELKEKTAKAEIEKTDAEEKTREANEIAKTCDELVAQAQEEFALVKPLIDQAINAVSSVKKTDLDSIKKLTVLNIKVEFVMEALLIFKKADAWKTKDMLLKVQNAPDKDGNLRSPYDIKECLMKKIGFNDTMEILRDLESFGKEENLNMLKNEYSRNMELLDEFITNSKFQRKDVVNGAEMIVGLYDFFNLMIKYVRDSREKIDKTLEKVAVANKEKEVAVKKKNEAEKNLKQIEAEVNKSKTMLEEEKSGLKKLKDDLDEQKLKLSRAEQLITLLSTEKERWEKTVTEYYKEIDNLIGDCIIAASSIAYNGPFTYEYRVRLEKQWLVKIKELDIVCSPDATMKGKLEDKIKLREWTVNGLPQDNLSIENAIIIEYTKRFPLIIDPQGQGSNFLKKQGKRSTGIEICKANDPNLMSIIAGCIKLDKMCLLEGVGIYLDPALDIILAQGNNEKIKLAENEYTIHNFKLFISTTLPNPHYSPETFVKVTIINFGITPKGLEEQMMTLLINNEMPELEQRKNTILLENFQSTKELRNTEDNILEMLSQSKGDINQFLKSDDLIITLQESKTKSEEINRKMKESEETAKEIDEKRESYRSAAYRGSLLFFATIDLANISPMYQFSLQWYAKLYESSIKNTQPSPDIRKRVEGLNRTFLKMLYDNVCRSVFEKDKLLYSMLLTHKLIVGEREGKLKSSHWKFFLSGPSGEVKIPKCPVSWINSNEWPYMYRQIKYIDDNFQEYLGLEKDFLNKIEDFKEFYDSQEAHKSPFPGVWEEKFKEFDRLLLLKALRPDKLVNGIYIWITESIGPEFIEAPGYNLVKSYRESSNIIPIVFVLSPGSDPINDIQDYTVTMGYEKKFDFVSLGRGQEKRAKEALESMRNQGGWALLQNCHLAPSFMGELEEIVENFDTNWPDKDFRLWLTSVETNKFPASILQNSVKITIEPPKGLRSNLKRSYNKLDNKDLEDCVKPNEFKCLLFGLSFFHAIVQDRRKYGPIGWNNRYDFTNEDWLVSKKQLKIFLEDYPEIPYKVLDFLIGDINYGGRVTDDKDQRLIKTILATYLNDSVLNTTSYKFSKSGLYYCPEIGDHDVYTAYIEQLPLESPPEVFGLHQNADITTAQNEAAELLETILSIQPRESGGGGNSISDVLTSLADEIEKKVGSKFDLEQVFKDFPTDYNESMNTVLFQEVYKYNKLIKTMTESLKTLKLALQGKIVMSEEIEAMSQSLFINQVPVLWSSVFLSLKPLSSWMQDYTQRIDFFKNWIEKKTTPNIFWFPSKLFFF